MAQKPEENWTTNPDGPTGYPGPETSAEQRRFPLWAIPLVIVFLLLVAGFLRG